MMLRSAHAAPRRRPQAGRLRRPAAAAGCIHRHPLVAAVVLLLALLLVTWPGRIIAAPAGGLNPGNKVTIEGTKYKVKSELGAGKNGKTFKATSGFLGGTKSVIKEQKRVPFNANELDATKKAGQLRGVSKDNTVMAQKPVGTHAIRDYLRENKDNKKFLKAGEDPAANPKKVKMSDHIAQSVKNQQTKVGYAHNDLTFGNNMRVNAKKKDARGAPKVELIDWGAASKLKDGKLSDSDHSFIDRTAKSLCSEVGLAFRSKAGSRLFRRAAACSRPRGNGAAPKPAGGGGNGGGKKK
ncbi:hypothetical protein DFJ73DRAFT_769858 [Zopfochytrium polystomum]|nr:hypothetical protein DFJ73DRAFT_769858 [Zopfochytrium polystomum]